MHNQYLRFFLPLAATSILFVSGNQARNAILARYPDPARHLSTYAYALSAFVLFWSANNFVPQMNNVFARSQRGRRVARNTVWLINLSASAVLLGIALTPVGSRLLSASFDIHGEVLQEVQFYVGVFAPLLPVSGQLRLLEGLLVQGGHNRVVTLTQFVEVSALLLTLWLAFKNRLNPMSAVLASHYAGSLARLVVAQSLCQRYYRLPDPPGHKDLSYAEVLRFLWPTALTSLMFTLSRPVLYACLGRTEQPLVAVAALRIAYDVLAALQQISNQFRHFFVNFGDDDLTGKRRFMLQVALVLTALLGLCVLPGMRQLVFGKILGTRGEVYRQAVAATTMMLAGPLILMARNYFHGRLLAKAIPTGMAVGAVARALLLGVSGLILLKLGVLQAWGAAISLLLGFLAEVLVSRSALHRAIATDELTHGSKPLTP